MTDLVPTSKQLHDFIDDLEKCIEYEFEEKIDCDNIVLCGMGGSAISGNIVADYCLERSSVPITVVMNACLPNWVNERTLLVISSYSGNTLETLEAYKQSLSIGCKRVVITCGGILKEAAEKNGDTIILLPDNLHPRHSIGYMIGYIFGIVKASANIESSKGILGSINQLRKYRDKLEDRKGIAMQLAKSFVSSIPVICSYSNIQSIIFRWKTQFNENSKYVAFSATMSEFVYSDLKGWVNNQRSNYSLMVIVDDDKCVKDDEYVSRLIRYLDDHRVGYRLLPLGGRTPTENMFRALMLGDYISMYMAEIQNIDSSSVPPITLLKKKLKPLIDDCAESLIR